MELPCKWWLEESPALIAVLDSDLVCRDMTPHWRARLQLPESDALTVPLTRIFNVDGDGALLDELRGVSRGSGNIHGRRVELRAVEEATWGLLTAWRAEHRDIDGPATVVSVTDAGEFEDAMRDYAHIRSAHQLILDAAGEGIYGLDADGRLTFGNAATYEILGWQVDEILGHKSHDVHHHSYPDGSPYPREDCPIYAAIKDGEIHRVDDEVFWHTNGSAVPVEYTSTPIMKDGKPNGAVVVFRDISKRKEVERQREEAHAEIQKLTRQLEQERDYLRDEIKVTMQFGEIIGESPALKRTLAKVEAVADTSANVLILGESGVGKEMIARAIHTMSGRAEYPLIKVNCASIPKDLFESEFFGHVRGAFTGAHQDRVGRLQLASGGTLFLDEVGEIPLALQSKLLRALQEQEFERVGDDETISVDVRVVAATNRDLEKEVAAGRFREDLYYRLSVFPVELPPLRDRVQDVIPLATHFLNEICAELGRGPLSLTKQQAELLQRHEWPGNIRELRNVIERSVILTKGSRLRLDLAMNGSGRGFKSDEPEDLQSGEYLTEIEFRQREKDNLIAALRCANWRVWGPDGAAALLGIKPSTLAYRMNSFGIEKDDATG